MLLALLALLALLTLLTLSNLTSNRAVAQMISDKVEHIMTASGGKNQTPTLDNLIQQVMARAGALLRHANLGPEYSEWAIREATEIVNLLPRGRHRLRHSAMQQWTGKAKQEGLNRETFGADAYVMLEPSERDSRDKLLPVAVGGDGRYRFVGSGNEIGHRTKGALILDTTTGTLMHRRSYTLNQNMDQVRRLPLPKRAWPTVPDEESMTLSTGADDFVDTDAKLLVKGAPNPSSPMTPGKEGAPAETNLLPCDLLPHEKGGKINWSTQEKGRDHRGRVGAPWHQALSQGRRMAREGATTPHAQEGDQERLRRRRRPVLSGPLACCRSTITSRPLAPTIAEGFPRRTEALPVDLA